MLDVLQQTLDYFGRVFIDPYVLAIGAIQEGGEQQKAGIILLLVALAGHAVILILFKLVVYNTVFPKLRTIDEYKNRTLHCRIYVRAKPSSDIFRRKKYGQLFISGEKCEYWWSKFRLFPIFDFHRIKVEDGWRHRRFPWTLDLFTNAVNIVWNSREQTWELVEKGLTRHPEDMTYYKDLAMTDVKEIADNVLTGVKGDYDLIKDKFKLGLSVQKVIKPRHIKDDDEDEDEDDGESGQSPE